MKFGKGYMTFSLDELLDVLKGVEFTNEETTEESDDFEELEGMKDEVKLETTNLQLLSLGHEIIFKNILMKNLTQREAGLLMGFMEKLVLNVRERFVSKDNKNKGGEKHV